MTCHPKEYTSLKNYGADLNIFWKLIYVAVMKKMPAPFLHNPKLSRSDDDLYTKKILGTI